MSLVPARTDTKWWQLNAPVASLVVFIRGRLRFGSIESWKESYQADILKPEATWKQLNALVCKIGGKACNDAAQIKMAGSWLAVSGFKPLPWTYSQWLELDHVCPDSAPFPSAFVVFGEINKAQRAKLASYGWAVEKGNF